MSSFIDFRNEEDAKYAAAERFVCWLEQKAIKDARGDDLFASEVNPTGRFWLGRLGPKDEVTRLDGRADRLEPCAIGLRVRPKEFSGNFSVRVSCVLWLRDRATEGDHRWKWTKTNPIVSEIQVTIPEDSTEKIFGQETISASLSAASGQSLSGEVRIRRTTRSVPGVEITFVNSTTPADELVAVAEGRFFECSLTVQNLEREYFELDSLPDSFRYDRKVEAFGINCGIHVSGLEISTCDSLSRSRLRPSYWAGENACPDMEFTELAKNPLPTCNQLAAEFEKWAISSWSEEALSARASAEGWSAAMQQEASTAASDFNEELQRVKRGVETLESNSQLLYAFKLMNRAMKISARGKYSSWRPFQLAFLLSNIDCLVDPKKESEVVDIVWFATGGGKTETYLGLLITAALLDRIRGKLSGITAWSRFPLRLLSLQQTQRFANALAAAEIVRREETIEGDPFSLGFLVGGAATPNRILKENKRETDWDADRVEDLQNPFRLLDVCPFCRERSVSTNFDRRNWRLIHTCSTSGCESQGEPLPLFVIDDEIWRFLPTIVVGTLDKAANIARQPGMRGLVGSPWGICSRPGHGYTYAKRYNFPNGCLVPDCKGGNPSPLPIEANLYAPSFRLQDELHLLRDSLGAVDAHYEAILDGLQHELTGSKPKILASSATLAGYQKQTSVLYRRSARVFPQPAPREGAGFWAKDSELLMRRYIALAPRRLTVEFVVDRLIVTLQQAIRSLNNTPALVCEELNIDVRFASFLINIYGTNVIYGNTLQDLDAVVRSSETQYTGINPPPNIETLTGRTEFEDVRATLDRLEHPEENFDERIHLIAASSMMSHGVDIDRLNIMVMLAFPLGVSEFIQATARVGRRWPALVIVVPKMTRERDASLYRAFPEFVSQGDRFIDAIPITRKSRRVLERTIAGMELARLANIHEPNSTLPLTTPRNLNAYVRDNPDVLESDRQAISRNLELDEIDEFLLEEMALWFEGFRRNLREPTSDAKFVSDLSPTGQPMLSLRDVEEQAPVNGDNAS
ncbi:helicase [Afipia carboxidovorans OM5]|uniref:Putative DNA helicase n=1 Tax=Afipia carboxidovorans (strain ATCC 49405 / DSM 1227 / KCTC 32145 / OM5) TaxID=504832 RepID=B6J9R4_AFIC5|nr:helicase-related protein [Afipia carboxidovorans]ACI91296.1 helicase [Afipia carboxidovorans OM5]AEI01516.1 putative DNA helicase [Afipia carboxidovorans OM4]AEI05091.1 putative DNA helicase [Afipia carboxidovorans OM5]